MAEKIATEKMIKVMKAFTEDKTIQCKKVNDNDWDAWFVCNPAWDWVNYEYRVKPEKKEPKYRPYKDLEEFKKDIVRKYGGSTFENIFETRNIWLKSKYGEYMGQIVGLTNELIFVDGNYYEWRTLFDKYTYLDGSPFGIEG